MATSGRREVARRILRLTDGIEESHEVHEPIFDIKDTPIESLENAVNPLVPFLPDIRKHAVTAKKACKNPPPDGLTFDESASIRLYSMEWVPHDKCLYVVLNDTLRSEDGEKVKPWFLYLKLFRTALERLPKQHLTVYRGVKKNLHEKYNKVYDIENVIAPLDRARGDLLGILLEDLEHVPKGIWE
ncbi:unnamed protein product, partial [Rotaria sp. Silwood1]